MKVGFLQRVQQDRKRRLRSAGYSLMELMVAAGLGTIVLGSAMAGFLFSGRSFAGMNNYLTLNAQSRNALDTMCSEIRGADFLRSWTSNSTIQQLVFQTTDPATGQTNTLSYTYLPGSQTLVRTNGSQRSVLLTSCTSLSFGTYLRNPIGGVYDQYPNDPVAQPGLCKLVQISWVCSRNVLGSLNSDSVQSAKVVIRKE
jgi:Tfp pilus assembly protein PilW